MKKVGRIVEGKTMVAKTQRKRNHQVDWPAAWAKRHLLVAGELLGGGSHGSKGSEGLSDFGGSLLSGSS